MTAAIPTARLEEIREGCEGVTAGPYHTEPTNQSRLTLVAVSEVPGANNSTCVLSQIAGPDQQRNGEHFARLDPATVRAIVSELIERRNKDAEHVK